jgi:hypothetical protein
MLQSAISRPIPPHGRGSRPTCFGGTCACRRRRAIDLSHTCGPVRVHAGSSTRRDPRFIESRADGEARRRLVVIIDFILGDTNPQTPLPDRRSTNADRLPNCPSRQTTAVGLEWRDTKIESSGAGMNTRSRRSFVRTPSAIGDVSVASFGATRWPAQGTLAVRSFGARRGSPTDQRNYRTTALSRVCHAPLAVRSHRGSRPTRWGQCLGGQKP